ncbi:MAG: hypothetical protein Q9213_006409, partial [Squamulea squamosa]
MASLIFAGGVLAYEKIKSSKAKKTARKAHNAARYSDLQSSTCTCSSTEKENRRGCPVHDVGSRDGVAQGDESRKGEEEPP